MKIGLIAMLCLFRLTSTFSQTQDSIPDKNKEVIACVTKYGPGISPTYQQAVCTELLIGVLEHFIQLTKEDKTRIRIITKEDVYQLREQGSPIPKGVYYALTATKKGIAIDDFKAVRPGDFVQFWETGWGHCGIVESIDPESKSMRLYSSFPSTDGYGIQEFNIPRESYFVRLK